MFAPSAALRGNRQILLERTHDLLLLCWSLVGTMTKLRRCINPFKVDLLERATAGMYEHGLTKGHDSLFDTWDCTLEHDKVVVDLAITHETTHPAILLE